MCTLSIIECRSAANTGLNITNAVPLDNKLSSVDSVNSCDCYWCLHISALEWILKIHGPIYRMELSVPYNSFVLFVVARDRLSRLAVCGGNTSCSWAVWPSCVSSVQTVAALEVCVVSAAQVGELTPLSARTSGSSASCSGIRTRGTPTDQSSQTILPLGVDQRTATLLYSRNRVVELTC